MNWLDLVLALILLTSIWTAFTSGLARMVIGIAAAVLAYLFASWSYRMAGAMLLPYVTSATWANLLGFALVFLLVLFAGAIVSRIVQVLFRFTGLSVVDRLLGAAFGAVRGVLIGAVLVMVLLAFPPAAISHAVEGSQIAPYVTGAARGLAALAPHELKRGVERGYERVRQVWPTVGRRSEL